MSAVDLVRRDAQALPGDAAKTGPETVGRLPLLARASLGEMWLGSEAEARLHSAGHGA